jgi:hypothetical protein
VNGLVTQSGAQRRLANSFRGTGRDTTPPTREAKDRIINFHISTINAMLRAKGKPELSTADYGRIHAAAEGSHSTSSESIMQAVLSAATAALPNDAQSSFKKMLDEKGIDEAAYYNAIAKYGAGLGSFDAIINAARGIRNGSSAWETSQASYSSVAVANFSSNNGVLSGMTPAMYREHFQTYYGATPQGQFTATRVANVLATNEGLTGAALVARTKEVGHDTGVRLGLDTNRFAPKVANIGKKYSEPAITYKEMLDKAIELQKQGNQAAADEMSRQAEALRKQQEEKAKREDPSKAPDVGSVYSGVFAAGVRNGYKPADVQASMLKFEGDPKDPKAIADHETMLKKVAETPQGAAAVEAYRAERAKVAEVKREEQATADTAVRGATKDEDDVLASLPAAQPGKKAEGPPAPVPALETATKTAEVAVAAPTDNAKKVETAAKKDEPPKKVATAANVRGAAPV